MAFYVKPGETYTDLAERLGLDAFELKMANGGAPLNAGQSVRTASGSRRAKRSRDTRPRVTSPKRGRDRPKRGRDRPKRTGGGDKVAQRPVVSKKKGKERVPRPPKRPPITNIPGVGILPTPETADARTTPPGELAPELQPRVSLAPPDAGSYDPSAEPLRPQGPGRGEQTVGQAAIFGAGRPGATLGGAKDVGRAESLEGSGTFSQTAIQKWQQYYDAGYNTMPHIDTYVQQYTDHYMASLIDGDLNHVPNALLSSIDVAGIDPDWLAENADQLAGLDQEAIVALWLASLGYEFSKDGNYMSFNPNSTGAGAGSGGGGGAGGGGFGGRRFGGGGGGYPYGKTFYNNATSGLTNWRNMGYA